MSQIRSLITAMILTASTLSLPVSANEPEAGTSATGETLQGSVLKIDGSKPGTMIRLSRPSSDSLKSELQTLNARVAGQDASNPQLKSRILQAAGLATPLTGGMAKSGKRTSFSLSNEELRRLSKYDISVLIDSSGSMRKQDCEPLNVFLMNERFISRWEWCKEQTSILSQEVEGVFPSGISVTTFASHAWRHPNVPPSAINDIFNNVIPDGATRLDYAFDQELGAYFSEKALGGRKKPLLIAVITDGGPSSPQVVVDQVLELSRSVKPGEVRIVFFLIGEAELGSSFIGFLSHLRQQGISSYEIVSSHSFDELNEQGLARALAHSVE